MHPELLLRWKTHCEGVALYSGDTLIATVAHDDDDPMFYVLNIGSYSRKGNMPFDLMRIAEIHASGTVAGKEAGAP